jgi:hypothetical protein
MRIVIGYKGENRKTQRDDFSIDQDHILCEKVSKPRNSLNFIGIVYLSNVYRRFCNLCEQLLFLYDRFSLNFINFLPQAPSEGEGRRRSALRADRRRPRNRESREVRTLPMVASCEIPDENGERKSPDNLLIP